MILLKTCINVLLLAASLFTAVVSFGQQPYQPVQKGIKTIQTYVIGSDKALTDQTKPHKIEKYDPEGMLLAEVLQSYEFIYNHPVKGTVETRTRDLIANRSENFKREIYYETDTSRVLTRVDYIKYREDLGFFEGEMGEEAETRQSYTETFAHIPDSVVCDTCSHILQQTFYTKDHEGRDSLKVTYMAAPSRGRRWRYMVRTEIWTYEWVAPDLCISRKFKAEVKGGEIELTFLTVKDSLGTIMLRQSNYRPIDSFGREDALSLPRTTYKWNKRGDWVECINPGTNTKSIRKIEYYE